MLALALAAWLVLPTDPDVHAEPLTGAELARLARVAPTAGHLVLGPGESVEVPLVALVPARSVGVWWEGDLGDAHLALHDTAGGEVAFASLDEAHDLAPDVVGPHRPAGRARVSGLVHAHDGPAHTARLVLTGPVDLASLTTVWIGADGAPPGGAPAAGGVTGGSYPKPPVWSRTSWGAYAPQCGVSHCLPTTHVGVHHSASSSDWSASTWSQCASNVKSIQAYHMFTNGWCDIGYNYLVCKHGDLFEGRGGGAGVVGAHDGFNCGSLGVCLMGYFHTPHHHQPTPSMLDALESLAAWKCDQEGISPHGSSWYAGYAGVKPHVYGHKDVKPTACPGDNVYALLGAVKNGIAAELAGGGGGPGSGTLKGILHDLGQGTGAPIAGGVVSLTNGSYVTTGANGYYEFALPAGSYTFGATAPGHEARWASETVTSGDVWESLGLPASNVPAHWVVGVAPYQWQANFQADAGSPIYFAYSAKPSAGATSLPPWGVVWPDMATLQVLFLGTSPVTGTVYATLTGPATPGLVFHSQALVVSGGSMRLTSGAAFQTP